MLTTTVALSPCLMNGNTKFQFELIKKKDKFLSFKFTDPLSSTELAFYGMPGGKLLGWGDGHGEGG